jgi:hypothetical protein
MGLRRAAIRANAPFLKRGMIVYAPWSGRDGMNDYASVEQVHGDRAQVRYTAARRAQWIPVKYIERVELEESSLPMMKNRFDADDPAYMYGRAAYERGLPNAPADDEAFWMSRASSAPGAMDSWRVGYRDGAQGGGVRRNPPPRAPFQSVIIDRSGRKRVLGGGSKEQMRQAAMATWLGDPDVRSAYVVDHAGHSHMTLEPRDRHSLRSNPRLTPAQRKRLPARAFVFPKRRAWPIESAEAAHDAIEHLQMGHVKSASDYLAIMNFIRDRYPSVWRQYGFKVTWTKAKRAKAKARTSRAKTTRRRRTSRAA